MNCGAQLPGGRKGVRGATHSLTRLAAVFPVSPTNCSRDSTKLSEGNSSQTTTFSAQFRHSFERAGLSVSPFLVSRCNRIWQRICCAQFYGGHNMREHPDPATAL